MFNRRKITAMSIQKSIFSLLICFVRLWAAFREPLNAGLTVVSVLLLCGLSFLIHPFCACQGLCGESPTAAWGEDFTCLPAEPGSKLSQHVMILCVPNTFPAAAAASLHSRCLFRNAGKWVSLPVCKLCGFQVGEPTLGDPPSFWQTPECGHTSGGVTFHPVQSFVFVFGAEPQLFPAVSGSRCPAGVSCALGWLFQYFSLPPLAWWDPPGSGFCSAQQEQRHQQKQSRAFFIPMQVLDRVTWSL